MARLAAALLVAFALACGSRETAAPATAPAPTPAPPATASAAPGPLAPLRDLVGSYPRDVGLFEREPLHARLAALLGDALPVFVANMGVQGPVSEQDGLLYVTGNLPHSGGDEAAALLIDPAADAIFVWLLHEGAIREHPEAGKTPSALPADVQATLDNWSDLPGEEQAGPG